MATQPENGGEARYKVKIAFEDCTDDDAFPYVIYVDAEPRGDGQAGDEFQVIMGMMHGGGFVAYSFLGILDQAGYFVARRATIKTKTKLKFSAETLVTIALDTLNAVCQDDDESLCFINGAYDPLTLFNFAIDGPAITN